MRSAGNGSNDKDHPLHPFLAAFAQNPGVPLPGPATSALRGGVNASPTAPPTSISLRPRFPSRDPPLRSPSAPHGCHRHRPTRPERPGHPGRQSLDHRRRRHAGHLHGGAGHRHRLRRPSLHRRLALRHHRRGHLGPHQLPRSQRRRPARQQLVLTSIRPQALPDDLHRHLHHRKLRLRSCPLLSDSHHYSPA